MKTSRTILLCENIAIASPLWLIWKVCVLVTHFYYVNTLGLTQNKTELPSCSAAEENYSYLNVSLLYNIQVGTCKRSNQLLYLLLPLKGFVSLDHNPAYAKSFMSLFKYECCWRILRKRALEWCFRMALWRGTYFRFICWTNSRKVILWPNYKAINCRTFLRIVVK